MLVVGDGVVSEIERETLCEIDGSLLSASQILLWLISQPANPMRAGWSHLYPHMLPQTSTGQDLRFIRHLYNFMDSLCESPILGASGI